MSSLIEVIDLCDSDDDMPNAAAGVGVGGASVAAAPTSASERPRRFAAGGNGSTSGGVLTALPSDDDEIKVVSCRKRGEDDNASPLKKVTESDDVPSGQRAIPNSVHPFNPGNDNRQSRIEKFNWENLERILRNFFKDDLELVPLVIEEVKKRANGDGSKKYNCCLHVIKTLKANRVESIKILKKTKSADHFFANYQDIPFGQGPIPNSVHPFNPGNSDRQSQVKNLNWKAFERILRNLLKDDLGLVPLVIEEVKKRANDDESKTYNCCLHVFKILKANRVESIKILKTKSVDHFFANYQDPGAGKMD